MFAELFNMPVSYDMGIDIRTIRIRKQHRKGANKRCDNKETIQMTSQEVADVSREAMSIILSGRIK